MQFLLTN